MCDTDISRAESAAKLFEGEGDWKWTRAGDLNGDGLADLIIGDGGAFNLTSAKVGANEGNISLFAANDILVNQDIIAGDGYALGDTTVGGNDTIDGGEGDDVISGDTDFLEDEAVGGNDVMRAYMSAFIRATKPRPSQDS